MKGLAGLETHHLKLVFQMHFEKLKQTAAQKSALNMDIVVRQVETKVVDAGDAEGVFVDCSGKPSLAIRVALLDFGNVDPTELLENIESSTQSTMSGWVVKSESTGKKAKGGLLRNKGMVDLALDKFASTAHRCMGHGGSIYYGATIPGKGGEGTARRKMTMPVFLEAAEYMMSDMQRAKDFCERVVPPTRRK